MRATTLAPKVTTATDPIRIRVSERVIYGRLTGLPMFAYIATIHQGDPETEDYLEHNGSGATKASAVKSAVSEWRRARRLYRRRAT